MLKPPSSFNNTTFFLGGETVDFSDDELVEDQVA